MKLEAPIHENYAAIVIRVPALVKLPNSDRLFGLNMFGLQAIVDGGTQEGELGLFFPSECQLSEEYAYENDLYDHAENNRHHDKKGYFGNNRRVRAIKLRGNRSDAFYMPVHSLKYLGKEWQQLREGDVFDKIGDHVICQKYFSKAPRPQSTRVRKEPRVDVRLFPEHFETAHFARVSDQFPDSTNIIITQKLHGTSVRIGNVPVKRKLSILERIAKFLGVQVPETKYAMVYGSHHGLKGPDNPEARHFYDEDLWSITGKKLDGLIPENYIVYGEIIGWTSTGKPIQQGYTYQLPQGESRLFVYRVAVINNQGRVVDLGWETVKAFCDSIGVMHVPELDQTWVGHFEFESYADKRFTDQLGITIPYTAQPVPLAAESPCDEGVCIRIEEKQLIPVILKAKSPLFLQHETRLADEGVIDVETAESTDEAEVAV